ncbi:hypothetical protein Tco_0516383, partial [Tanacetum coccineum]
TIGYLGVVDKVSAFYMKFLAQPWQTMFKEFNRCLTTRTSRHDQTKINILQLFHVVVNRTNIEYAALLWECAILRDANSRCVPDRNEYDGVLASERNAKESWALLEDLALYDNESWNDPRDLAKPVKAISLHSYVPSTSDRRLIKLENQVQCLIEAHLSSTQPTQVNKITTSYEICSGPHDTQYCMKDPEQASVEYSSSRTDEVGEGLVFNFLASQDARLSKFETDFIQQQSKMTNKIDTVLKAITDRIGITLS